MRRSNVRALSSSSEFNLSKMDSVRLSNRPASVGSNILFRNPKHASRFNLFIFVFIAVTLFLLLFMLTKGYRSSINRRFGIVIDGGSTGTRIHIAEFTVDNAIPIFNFDNDAMGAMRVNPGLSSYAEDPDGAGNSLMELLEFGRGRIPRYLWEHTEIRLMATAGMRLLELDVQERILNSCRRVLRSSGFKFRDEWASVISGSDEGVYAWVVANYALGTLDGVSQKTTGIIELGGASAQITFVSDEPQPPEYSRTLLFRNSTYNLYSHSLLHFGQNVAFESLRDFLVSEELRLSAEPLQELILKDPCSPKGYLHQWNHSSDSSSSEYLEATLHAAGNFSQCRAAVMKMFGKQKERCFHAHCRVGSAFIPELHGNFLATENFFYTSKFFGLRPGASLSEMAVAGKQFCESEWHTLRLRYDRLDEEDLLRYCFSSAYIVSLLHDGLGLDLDDARIEFTSRIGNIPLDWALGAFIMQMTSDSATQHHHWISSLFSDNPPTFRSMLLITVALLFAAWSVLRWKKPRLKTIYDLEKGRYIVTRVNRR